MGQEIMVTLRAKELAESLAHWLIQSEEKDYQEWCLNEGRDSNDFEANQEHCYARSVLLIWEFEDCIDSK